MRDYNRNSVLFFIITIFLVCLYTLSFTSIGRSDIDTHLPGTIISKWSTNPVTLDGTVTYAAEWRDAISYNISMVNFEKLPDIEEEFTATWWFKNDAEWLYVLCKWQSAEADVSNGIHIILFWDIPMWQKSDFGGLSFTNSTWDAYGWDETQWYGDVDASPPGQVNIQGVASYDGSNYWIEFRKALNSGDGYDWNLSPGDLIGDPTATTDPSDLKIGIWVANAESAYERFISLKLLYPQLYSVHNLVIEPASVSPGADVSVSIDVENQGQRQDTYTLILKINGRVEDQKDVTVNAGATETITFTISRDTEGNFNVDIEGVSGSFTVKATFNWTLVIAGVAVIAVIAAVVILFLKKKKPKEEVPKLTSLKISADPTELMADGKSTSAITVELLDAEGKPIEAQEDTNVGLSTTLGRITKSLTIRKGDKTGRATLTSSTEFGELKVKAVSRSLKSASLSMKFIEKRRYCMHCGTRMPLDADVCQKCNRSPPSGVDVKICDNCGEVMPIVAYYCSACGARQPKIKRRSD